MEKENLYYFEKAPIAKAVAHFAIPMMLGMSMTVVYSILNAYFIGFLQDAAMLTAITLALPVFALIMAFGNLIGMGGGTYISRLLGEKNYYRVKQVSSISIYSSMLLGLLIIIITVPFIDSIVSLLGSSLHSFDYTKQYVLMLIIGSPFIILFFTMEQLVRSEGAANVSMIGMILSVAINIVLDLLFIFVLKLGIMGVAAATILSNIMACIYFSYYMGKKSKFLTLSFREFSFEKTILKHILTIGVPVFLMNAFMGVTALFFNHFMMIYGDKAVAGYGISSRLQQFPEFFIMGVCEGVVPLIAYSFTADRKRMKKVLAFTSKLILGMAVLFGLIIFFTSSNLIGLFTNDIELITVGSYILKVTFLSMFLSGFTFLIIGMFQATGQGTAAFVMAFVQGLVLIPILFFANFTFGFHGVVWSLFIADSITFIVAAAILYVLRNKLNSPSVEELLQGE
ncbi:MATE family efflux transporter [Bacillus circulans]|uniref:MATE family efflux transporter n=1 Tax=Niallia circulans TaxID=1397 RepID=UPI00156023AA|nr:MATE family efflux transporter [Niallia circulans]NRG26831.1 MATE family efflux transporter [Niallia circulans]